MGKLSIGPRKGNTALSKSPEKQVEIQKVIEFVDRVERVEIPVEVIKEVVVEKLVEVPVEVVKEVEKVVELRIPYLEFRAPKWAKWAAVAAIVEFVIINLLLAIG